MDDNAPMFEGLDAIDWASMEHAFGPATDVPDLLRGLASDDVETRENSFEAMYVAVHHQGDVYDSTVATIPFLLAMVRDPAVADRALLVELLASYGGYGAGSVKRHESEPGSEYETATLAVGAAWDDFARLLDDPVADVRVAAVSALAVDPARDAATAELLLRHHPTETDLTVGLAILNTLGLLTDQAGVPTLLADVAATSSDTRTRMVAQASALGPDGTEPSAAIINATTAAVLELYRNPRSARPDGDRPEIDTIRRIYAQFTTGRSHPDIRPLLLKLFRGFGDRFDDQHRLVVRLLRCDSWEARLDAILLATMLMDAWRGDHTELIDLIAGQLDSDQPLLRARAAGALADCHKLAAPAADALARVVATAPRQASNRITEPEIPWLTLYENSSPSLGPALHALVNLRDPRALPALAWVLEQPRLPVGVGDLAARYGAEAAELVPVLLRRCEDTHDIPLAASLARAAVALAGDPVEAARALLVRDPNTFVLTALGELGPAAADVAVGSVRLALSAEEPRTRAEAALALWRLTGSTEGVEELVRELSRIQYRAMLAAEALAQIGPTAASAVPALQRLHTADREDYPWPQLHAAIALWRITGEAATSLSTLIELWPEYPYLRSDIAKCLATMGSAAEPALPLVREELTALRRFYVGPDYTFLGATMITHDEELLRTCRAIVDRFAG